MIMLLILGLGYAFSCFLAWLVMLSVQAFGYAFVITWGKIFGGGFIFWVVSGWMGRNDA